MPPIPATAMFTCETAVMIAAEASSALMRTATRTNLPIAEPM
jgi:hypothetical protein